MAATTPTTTPSRFDWMVWILIGVWLLALVAVALFFR